MRQALVVMAHPDDVDFWAAGSVARWVRSGTSVTYLLVTSGDAGGFEPSPNGLAAGDDRAVAMTARRRTEQQRAAAALGVSDVRFLEGFRDGHVTADDQLIKLIAQTIREVRPSLVLAPSPERTWTDIRLSHPDHLAVGEATARAVYPSARNPFAYPDLANLPAFEVRELWLQGDPRPDHVVDVTAVWDQRMAALMAHTSQHPDPVVAIQRAEREAEAVAAKWALPPGRRAEEFRRIAIPD